MNTILLVFINFLSIFLIIWIDFKPFPLISCHYDLQTIDNINKSLYVFSSGILIGSFFYLINIYIPERKYRKVLDVAIRQDINHLADTMQRSLAYFCIKYDWKYKSHEINGLDWEAHFMKIDIQKFDRTKTLGFLYNYTRNPLKTKISYEKEKEWEYFIKERDVVIRLIDKAFSNPNIRFADPYLLNLLNSLKYCKLYNATIPLGGSPYPPIHVNKGFSLAILEYYEIFQTMTKRKLWDLGEFEIKSTIRKNKSKFPKINRV